MEVSHGPDDGRDAYRHLRRHVEASRPRVYYVPADLRGGLWGRRPRGRRRVLPRGVGRPRTDGAAERRRPGSKLGPVVPTPAAPVRRTEALPPRRLARVRDHALRARRRRREAPREPPRDGRDALSLGGRVARAPRPRRRDRRVRDQAAAVAPGLLARRGPRRDTENRRVHAFRPGLHLLHRAAPLGAQGAHPLDGNVSPL
mmetsp:Transcript_14314/g.42989  ORF Transcript_14314/g.42989 Transcript_14314/m.42989 type:complete len:201 (+) Transcript_14314:1013-1615(+)